VLAQRRLVVAVVVGGDVPDRGGGGRGGSAVMVIECDQPAGQEAEAEIRALPGILKVNSCVPEQEGLI